MDVTGISWGSMGLNGITWVSARLQGVQAGAREKNPSAGPIGIIGCKKQYGVRTRRRGMNSASFLFCSVKFNFTMRGYPLHDTSAADRMHHLRPRIGTAETAAPAAGRVSVRRYGPCRRARLAADGPTATTVEAQAAISVGMPCPIPKQA